MRFKSTALLLVGLLVAGLCPAFAFAGDEGAPVAALTAASEDLDDDDLDDEEEVPVPGEGEVLVTVLRDPSLSYNKNGLIAKWKYDHLGALPVYGNAVEKFSYDKKGRLIKAKMSIRSGKYSYTYKFAYDKKGRLKKQTHYYDGHRNIVKSFKYSKNGRKVVASHRAGDDKTVYSMSFNKAGLMKKVIRTDYEYRRWEPKGWKKRVRCQFSYSYDRNGNIKKRTGDFGTWFVSKKRGKSDTYKLFYDARGRLTRCKGKKTGYDNVLLWGGAYKTIAVPKKYVASVKAQQRALVNPSLLAPCFGIDSYLPSSFTLDKGEVQAGGFPL